MTGIALVEEIVSILTAGIVNFGTAIGQGLSALASGIFFTTTGETTGLSVLGICILAFAGISMCVGLSRWVLNFFTSLGARNR